MSPHCSSSVLLKTGPGKTQTPQQKPPHSSKYVKSLAILHQTEHHVLPNLCHEQQWAFKALVQEQAKSRWALHSSDTLPPVSAS